MAQYHLMLGDALSDYSLCNTHLISNWKWSLQDRYVKKNNHGLLVDTSQDKYAMHI